MVGKTLLVINVCDARKISPRLNACNDQSIAVTIMHKGNMVDVCPLCWDKIAEGRLIKKEQTHEVPEPLFGCDE